VSTTVITNIFEVRPKALSYDFAAADSSNNITTITVTVDIKNPQLETISSSQSDTSERGTVTAEITPDIDT